MQLMMLNHNLEKCGLEVTTAINGQDAFEKVVQSFQKFDFIVLDLAMPIMNGYDAAEKIISHCQGDNNLFIDASNPS